MFTRSSRSSVPVGVARAARAVVRSLAALLIAAVAMGVLAVAAPVAEAAEFTFCANEGQRCSFSGTAEVHYGALGRYATKTFINGVDCSNNNFGDPFWGVKKACSYKPTSSSPPNNNQPSGGPPSGFTFCADEGKRCAFSGTADVWYGAGSRSLTKSFTSGVDCTNNNFSPDPAYGTKKACYYKITGSPPGGTLPNSARIDVPLVPQIWANNSLLVYPDGRREAAITGLENCGPASIAMVVQKYRGGGALTLDQAARTIRGRHNSNVINVDARGVRRAVNTPTDFKSPAAVNLLAGEGLALQDVNSFEAMKKSLAAGAPVIVLVDNGKYIRTDGATQVPYPNNSGWVQPHIVVVTGYDQNNVYVNDPLAWTARGKDFAIPIASFQSAASAKGWYASAVVRK